MTRRLAPGPVAGPLPARPRLEAARSQWAALGPRVFRYNYGVTPAACERVPNAASNGAPLPKCQLRHQFINSPDVINEPAQRAAGLIPNQRDAAARRSPAPVVVYLRAGKVYRPASRCG